MTTPETAKDLAEGWTWREGNIDTPGEFHKGDMKIKGRVFLSLGPLEHIRKKSYGMLVKVVVLKSPEGDCYFMV